jgi:hypothetical protein
MDSHEEGTTNKVRRTFVISALAGLFVIYILQPLIRLLWSGISRMSMSAIESYVNSIYKSSAINMHDHISLQILLVLFAMLSALLLTIGLLPTKAYQKSIRWGASSSRVFYTIHWIIVIIIHLAYLYAFVPIFIDVNINASFQQRLNALTPVLTSQGVNELRASWALMRTRDDYVQLSARMDSIAAIHEIDLPELLLK